jgi:hypothetical protein
MQEEDMVIDSPLFDTNQFKKQIELILNASDSAKEIVDYTTAHDDEVLAAIDVVEDFLKKKHRLCYGGQAINAHLPAKKKFYDPNLSIPDYDFFTPSQKEDILYLSKQLRKRGFREISAREGMHKGTIKIYVNFVPVADITEIDSKLYSLLSERESRFNGISYLDINTLKMLMYLELSRPRGEVTRWEKVYSRLMLLNYYSSSKPCKEKIKKSTLSENEVELIMKYIKDEKRIFSGADLVGVYKTSLHGKRRANWIMHTHKPIYFYSNELEKDSSFFKTQLLKINPESKLSVQSIKSMGGDLIPNMKVFLRDDYPVLIIIEQNACHAFYTLPLKSNKTIRIASLDTLITLYFSLSLLKYKYIDLSALECLAQELIEISMRARAEPEKFPFPFISLQCSGHQKRLASLIREKVRRIQSQRQKKILSNSSTPLKRNLTMKRLKKDSSLIPQN